MQRCLTLPLVGGFAVIVLVAENLLQAQLGVPHSRIKVELEFILQAGTCQILNSAQNPRQSQSVQGTKLNWVGGGSKCPNHFLFVIANFF